MGHTYGQVATIGRAARERNRSQRPTRIGGSPIRKFLPTLLFSHVRRFHLQNGHWLAIGNFSANLAFRGLPDAILVMVVIKVFEKRTLLDVLYLKEALRLAFLIARISDSNDVALAEEIKSIIRGIQSIDTILIVQEGF